MKSFGICALTGILLAGLVGCGGSKSDSQPSTGPFSTTSGATSNTTAVPGSQTTPVQPTQPSAPTKTTIVSGWLPYWTYTVGDQIIDANTGNGLDEVNLFGIGLEPDGSLSKRRGIEDQARINMIRARGGEVIPTIYDVHDKDALAAVLASPTARARAIQEMVDLMVQGNYDGIDIDFEHAKSRNRDAFSSFVEDLGVEIRSRGKVFSVTIPGKRRDTPSWAGYDYTRLAAAGDRVKIMTYGYSGTWTAAPGGPIAPTDWIKKVLDYAVTTMPANKIQIGIPFYGYDWPDNGGSIRSVTYRRSQTLLAKPSASSVIFEPTRGEAHFTYMEAGVNHTVWFSEERSTAAKAALVKQYGCLGISIWALGYGDGPLWDAIRAELKTP